MKSFNPKLQMSTILLAGTIKEDSGKLLFQDEITSGLKIKWLWSALFLTLTLSSVLVIKELAL